MPIIRCPQLGCQRSTIRSGCHHGSGHQRTSVLGRLGRRYSPGWPPDGVISGSGYSSIQQKCESALRLAKKMQRKTERAAAAQHADSELPRNPLQAPDGMDTREQLQSRSRGEQRRVRALRRSLIHKRHRINQSYICA